MEVSFSQYGRCSGIEIVVRIGDGRERAGRTGYDKDRRNTGIVQLEGVFLVIVQGGCFGLLLGLLFRLLGNVQNLANFDVIRVGDFGVCSLELSECDVELMGNGGQAIAFNNGVGHDFLGGMGIFKASI